MLTISRKINNEFLLAHPKDELEKDLEDVRTLNLLFNYENQTERLATKWYYQTNDSKLMNNIVIIDTEVHKIGNSFINILNTDFSKLISLFRKIKVTTDLHLEEYLISASILDHKNSKISDSSTFNSVDINNNICTLQEVKELILDLGIHFIDYASKVDELIDELTNISSYNNNDQQRFSTWYGYINDLLLPFIKTFHDLQHRITYYRSLVENCFCDNKGSRPSPIQLISENPDLMETFNDMQFNQCKLIYSPDMCKYDITPAHSREKNFMEKLPINNNCTYEIGDLIQLKRSLSDLFLYSFLGMAQSKTVVRKCENCGKLFFPKSRSDEKYCDNIFRNDKTCKKLGFDIKLSKDDPASTKRKASKTNNAWKQRNKVNITNADKYYETWAKEANIRLEATQNGLISHQDFEEWLKNDSWRKGEIEKWQNEDKTKEQYPNEQTEHIAQE